MPEAKHSDQYRILFDMAADCLLILDMSGRIVEINHTGHTQRGYTREEMVGRRISEFDPPDFAAKVPERMKALFTYGHARFESAHVCKDGRIMPVEINSRVIEFNGQPHVFSVIRDISAQMQSRQKLDEQSQFLNSIFDNSPTGIHLYQLEPDGRLVFTGANRAADLLLGVDNQQYVGQTIEDAFPALVNTEVPDQYRHIAATGKNWIRDQMDYHKGQINGVYSIQAFQTLPNQMAVFFEDITQRKQLEQQIHNSELCFRSIFDNAVDGILVADTRNMTLTSANPAICRMLGYSTEELLGMNVMDVHPQNDLPMVLETFGKQARGEIVTATLPVQRKDGSVFFADITAAELDLKGVHYVVGFFRDITKRKESEELIWRQANFDILTGLPNRGMMRDRLEQEIKKAHRAHEPLALLFIDLDRFKEVNDTLGHQMGDELLIEAGKRLASCVRETDTVARLGGDEFTVILTQLHGAGALEMLTRNIIEKLAEPYRLNNELVYASASIGIALYPDDADTANKLLQYADQAMYAAKESGRNRFCYFTPALQSEAQTRMKLISELSGAQEAGQFRVYFQPIVELATGRVFKAEALLRWLHPTRGLVSPMTFIPLAEETGHIVEIGEWVFHESMRWAKQWSPLRPEGFQISVNKSPVQFRSLDHAETTWPAYLHQQGLTGRNLAIEITEGLLLNRDDHTVRKLLQFRDAGIQVAIDDFGTGYSALSYLKKFDIDYLKIDQSFVRNMASDPADLALCEAIVVMAHKLGLKVIAEGVETRRQQELLAQIGCDLGQGYLFAKPMPAEELDALLKSGLPLL